MRILIAHNRYLHRGGEDVAFEAETALLREYGHEVHIWEEHNRAPRNKLRWARQPGPFGHLQAKNRLPS